MKLKKLMLLGATTLLASTTILAGCSKKTETPTITPSESGSQGTSTITPSSSISSPVESSTAPVISIYTVSFNLNTGEELDPQKVKKGEAVAKPSNPSRSGYVFAGWYLDEECNNAYDFASPVNSDLILYAKWEEVKKDTYLLTIEYHIGEDVKYDVISNPKLVSFITPSFNDYTFIGYVDEAGADVSLDSVKALELTENKTIILKAKFDKELEYVNVTLKNGEENNVERLVKGELLNNVVDPSKDGYLFEGWFESSEDTKAFDFSQTTIVSDITLVARFKEINKLNTTHFDNCLKKDGPLTENVLPSLGSPKVLVIPVNLDNTKKTDEVRNSIVKAYDDPVSKEEIYRNNVIFDNYQHNRNPYIDHPEYVDYVYPSKYAGTTKPVEPVEPSKPSPDPTPSKPDSSLKLDDYNFKKIESLSDISEGIYLIGGDTNYMVSDFMTGKDGVFACSDTPKEIFYLESTSNKWLLKNNQNKYLNIYGKTNSKFETEGTPFEIKEEKGGFNFSSGGFSFCYNKSAPRFTSYASSQGPLILYKATFKNDEAANFENLKISRSLAYHWSTNDNTNYTIDNACIRFGVKLTEEMKNLDGVKFGALVAKEDYMKDIDFKEYIRLTNASDAASVVKDDDNIKYLEFKNIASEGGMTSIRIDDIGASYDTKIVVVIYMEYNGKLYLTEATIGSFKSIASEYLNLNLDLSQDVINSLTQIVK